MDDSGNVMIIVPLVVRIYVTSHIFYMGTVMT